MKTDVKNSKRERRDFLKLMGGVAAAMTLPPFLVEELRAQAQGSNFLIISPDDPQWRSVTQPYNRRYRAANCRFVYMPTNTQGVVDALTAILNDLKTKNELNLIGTRQIVGVKSGGHCYQNHVFNSNTLYVIDMVLMDGVNIVKNSPTENSVTIQGGAMLWNVYNKVNRGASLVIPGGVCAGVGVGGHFQGGGYGLNSRQFGLVVDYIETLTSVIIDKDDSGNYIAKTVVAHKPTEPPSGNGDNYRLENWLFYGGTGGGGGNFGIVTEYTMKDLPHAPNYSYLAKIEIPWEQSPGVIFSETQCTPY